MAEDKQKSDANVISNYFGKLPGQNLSDFMAEYKALSSEDKKALADGIRDESFTY